MASITLSKVSKVYPPSVRAVDDLSLDVGDGEVVVLLGGPGCGKSTLLRMVAGIERPTSGQILFDGVDVAAATPPERRVAMLFQRPALYPKLTVAANIGFPLQTASVRAERATALVRASARATGVADLLDKHPHELTDEQQQRVAVARAMVRSPRLLLLDEPVSQVGGTAGAKLLAEIATLVRDAGITAVYVTPERGDAPAVADRIGVMRNGRIEDIGPPSRVYARPATAFTAALVGGPAVTLLDATVEMEDGSHTAAWLGRVGLALPWRDLQARELTHFHGERVVVGIPPEALRLVGPGPNAIGCPVLPGVVRRVVPLGAFSDSAVDIGGTAVDLDRDRSDDGEGGGRASSGALRRVEELAAVGGRHGRHGKHGPRRDLSEIPRASTAHPAELTVRTARADAPQQGSRVFVRVDLSRVHFFDVRGRRIGTGWR